MAKPNPFAGKKAPPFGDKGKGGMAPPFGKKAAPKGTPAPMPAFKRGGGVNRGK